jgi:hypothetical protein
MINIANLSEDYPIHVTTEEYEALKNRKVAGWSHCDTQKEWMVKLHYLRKGFKEGKIPAEQFFAKERDLVLNWWRRWC